MSKDAEVDDLIINGLREIIKAQDELLAAYRLGRPPKEWALDTLAKRREASHGK